MQTGRNAGFHARQMRRGCIESTRSGCSCVRRRRACELPVPRGSPRRSGSMTGSATEKWKQYLATACRRSPSHTDDSVCTKTCRNYFMRQSPDICRRQTDMSSVQTHKDLTSRGEPPVSTLWHRNQCYNGPTEIADDAEFTDCRDVCRRHKYLATQFLSLLRGRIDISDSDI